MNKANVRFSWQGSPSWNVDSYDIQIIDERYGVPNRVIVKESVAACVRSWDFEAERGATITASVVANDGDFTSQPSTTVFIVPDLGPPLPPHSASINLIEPID